MPRQPIRQGTLNECKWLFDRNISLRQIAKRIGISRQTLAKYKARNFQSICKEKLTRIETEYITGYCNVCRCKLTQVPCVACELRRLLHNHGPFKPAKEIHDEPHHIP